MNKSCRVILLLLFFPFILLGQTDTVLFSSRGGFYDESFTLALECQQGHRIRYTFNGETPTASSTLYNGLIFLDEHCFSRSNIHTIVNCIPSVYHAVYNAMNQGGNSLITNKFFENEGFKRMFQQRYYELSTSVFSYDALKHIWDRYRSIVEEEIPRQSERFGFPKSVQRWQSDMDSTEAFFLKRSRAYEQELFELLSVDEVASLEFSVFPNPNKGVFYILLDTDENVVLPIEMFDCLERRVYYRNSSFVGKTSVRVSAELPPGLYLLRVGHRSKRIVIQ